MSQLAKKVALATPAGVVIVPDLYDPWSPPMPEDRRRLYDHLFTVGLPVERWEQWAKEIGVTKVSEIKSMLNLVAVWAWVCAWQLENEVWTKPTCGIGIGIFEQIIGGTTKIELTAPELTLY